MNQLLLALVFLLVGGLLVTKLFLIDISTEDNVLETLRNGLGLRRMKQHQ